MGGITVTMPLREYEELKSKIAYLESQKISNFLTDEWHEFEVIGYTLDAPLVAEYINRNNNESESEKYLEIYVSPEQKIRF